MTDDVSYLPYASLLVVVVGWFVANHQANTREVRKEARSAVDEARKLIKEVANDSLKYFCEGKDELAVPIKSGLEALEVDLDRLPNFRVKDAPLMGRLVEFQDAVTGGDFEAKDRKRHPLDSAEVSAILRTRNALLAELERQFKAYFR